jgi:GT2 family glycosyltransferase
MKISIVMSTRDRGTKILPAVRSVLREQWCDSELILVDQSASDASQAALTAAGLLDHPRLIYRRTRSVGLSRGRNEGVRLARADIVAFTDDDCIVSEDWARKIVERFASKPYVAVLFASVVADPDATTGWIPDYVPLRTGCVTMSPDIIRSLGIGANFAMRRAAHLAIGPFDELMGAGSIFPSGEDTDFGYRALRLGLGVYTAHDPSVVHYGLREGAACRATATAYLRGMAAMAMKHVRCGDTKMAAPITRELHRLLVEGTGHLRRGRRPSGYGTAATLVQGVAASLRYRVDSRRRLYCSPQDDVLSRLSSEYCGPNRGATIPQLREQVGRRD